MVGTGGTGGTYTSAFQKMRSQVECNFRLGQLRHLGQRSTAADIFTTGDMVVGETITIDHLVSVYQGDANAVSDEGTSLMKNAQKWGQITFTRQMGMREQGF